MGNRPTTSWP